jgi:hypothetical protein
MTGKVLVVCAKCSGPLYECPMCRDTYHRPNVLLDSNGPTACLLCVEKSRAAGPLYPDVTLALTRHRLRFGHVGYHLDAELDCA